MAKNSSKSNTDKSQSAMGQLLAKHKESFVTFKKGDSVKGKITKITSQDILVDLGAKTEATILEKDKGILRTILGMFKLGDTVEVNVLNPESDSGQPVVSLRRYLGKLAWDKLSELQKNKQQIEVTVTETGKAGFVVATSFGVSGFLPQSHTTYAPQDVSIGSPIKASVLEINREENKIIFSQKTKMSDEDFDRAMKKFKVGQKVEATIANITPFGLFVTIGDPSDSSGQGLEGFIHISEVSWERQEDLSQLYTAGQKVAAVIARFDKETRRINLSIKKLTEDPFEETIKEFPVDKKVSGKVVKVDAQGVIVEMGPPASSGQAVEGIIKKDKIPPTMTFAVGQEVSVTVSEHDKRKHKIVLTPVLKEKPIGYR